MKTLRTCGIIFLCGIILLNLSCENDYKWTDRSVIGKRNLTEYNQGGEFLCSNRFRLDEENRFVGEVKVRDFIWNHWAEKRRGYIRMFCTNVDTSGTTHFFVEPNEAGDWIVTIVAIVEQSYGEVTRSDKVVTLIEKSKSDNNDYDWQLIGKSASGEEVQRLPRF